MEIRYDLISEGQIVTGCAPAEARRNVAKVFRREPHEIERLFSGKTYTLLRALDADTGHRCCDTLKRAGLVCRLVASRELSVAPGAPPRPETPIAKMPHPLSKGAVHTVRPGGTADRPVQPAPAPGRLELVPLDNPPPTGDAGIPVESTPALPALTQCPKCGYQAKGPHDLLLTGYGGLGQCPSCGVIPQKYLQIQRDRQEQLQRDRQQQAVESEKEMRAAEGTDRRETELAAKVAGGLLSALIEGLLS